MPEAERWRSKLVRVMTHATKRPPSREPALSDVEGSSRAGTPGAPPAKAFGEIDFMRMALTSAAKSARTSALWLAALLLAASPLVSQPPAVASPPTVVFMTDFGILDDSVALCKGVMYGITPNLRIVDLTHQVN